MFLHIFLPLFYFLGAQFKAVVEYAPSQRVPKVSSKKDGREGTIFKGICFYQFISINPVSVALTHTSSDASKI